MRNRSRNDLYWQILESARNGIGKTKIMYHAYLSYTQLKEYLIELEQRELIEFNPSNQIYKTTTKGLAFLQAYSKMDQLLPITLE